MRRNISGDASSLPVYNNNLHNGHSSQGRRLPLFNSKSLVRQCFAAAAMAVFLFMLLLGVLVSTPIAANQTVLVIDCGSTGTRIFAYTWQKSGATADTVPTVRAITPEAAPHKIPRKLGKGLYRRVETQPGLDAFLDDPKGLQSKALGPLLDWAYAVVPASEAAATPVFLLATGGVRRLPPADRDRLLEGARGVLAASKFRFEPGWARVIGGSEEGVYGWIALNYLHGGLGNRSETSHISSHSRHPPPLASTDAWAPQPLGAIDLGGSTLEVTFPLAAPPAGEADAAGVASAGAAKGGAASAKAKGGAKGGALASRYKQLSIAGTRHRLHTHSFKTYGLNDAFDRSVAALMQEAAAAAKAKAVSSVAGAVNGTIVEAEAARNANAIAGTAGADEAAGSGNSTAAAAALNGTHVVYHPCLFEGYEAPYHLSPASAGALPAHEAAHEPAVVTLRGRPDWGACSALAERLARASNDTVCNTPHCVLNVPMPPLAGRFIALTGFSVVWSYLKVAPSAGSEALLAAGRAYCRLPYATVQKQYGDQINYERYCLWAPYAVGLLRSGLALDESAVKIGGRDVSWPLGAALLEGLRLEGLADSSDGDSDGVNGSTGTAGEGAVNGARAPSLVAAVAMIPGYWVVKLLVVGAVAAALVRCCLLAVPALAASRSGDRLGGLMQACRLQGAKGGTAPAVKKVASVSSLKNVL